MENLMQFAEIGPYPTNLSSSAGIGRMLDGLCFKYYWTTEGLTEKDLSYDPGNGARNIYQILDHLYNMVDFFDNGLEGKSTSFPEKENNFDFDELREKTLKRINKIKKRFLHMEADVLEGKNIKVKINGNAVEFDMCHLFNGPLPDIISHLGQVVLLRRISGNPIDPAVNPFIGKKLVPA